MLFSYAAATVPKITVILRKAYGGAYLAMCSKDTWGQTSFMLGRPLKLPSWEPRRCGTSSVQKGARIRCRPKARALGLIDQYRRDFASPYQAAEHSLITDVIAPSETRSKVSMALRSLLTKRLTRPPEKHGLIPL